MYVINYADTRYGLCLVVLAKDEIPGTLKLYLRDMAHLGISVKHVQSDRGSEYFSQGGGIIADRNRKISAFDAICAAQEPPIRHIIQPVEMKEKVAEIWFNEHFRAGLRYALGSTIESCVLG